MIVYIVPFDEEKKVLNCKKWLGERKLLQEEQTEAELFEALSKEQKENYLARKKNILKMKI